MQAYLAQKYMSGPKADAILARTTKKKKRKNANEPAAGAAMIVDDDGGFGDDAREENEDIEQAVVEKDRSFKKRKTDGKAESGWATVREGAREETPPPAEDEAPMVVDEGLSAPIVGGLVTAEQMNRVASQKEKKKRVETREEQEAERAAQETVYRDATGRKIDTKAERAEAARKKREAEELEAKKMEWGKGVVQRDEEERRKRRMEEERKRDLAVYADDKELNEEQKARDRWNDPAAAFLSKKRTKGPRKPEYAGPPPPPNRFGIKPGYRWDGVDRSNGFEKKLFQKTNERKRKGLESYQWSVDEM